MLEKGEEQFIKKANFLPEEKECFKHSKKEQVIKAGHRKDSSIKRGFKTGVSELCPFCRVL